MSTNSASAATHGTTKVLIVGASGKVARHVIAALAERPDVTQTLFLRDAGKLQQVPKNARVVEGDVLQQSTLAEAMANQDVVYVNLAGAVDTQMSSVLAAMQSAGVDRMIFMNTLGIHDEVPGRFGDWIRAGFQDYLAPYRRALAEIQASGVRFTNIRSAWMNEDDDVDYGITERNEPFEGASVSRKSLGVLVAEIVLDPAPWEGRDIGVSKPGSVAPDPRLRG